MYNRPHRHHMWCANAWVGAPWACGEARYDESVENYEHNVTKSYEGFDENNCSTAGVSSSCNSNVDCSPNSTSTKRRTEERENCSGLNKKHCQKSYVIDSDGKPTIVCDFKNDKCKATGQYCANSTRCEDECPDDISCSPTPSVPVSGGLSGTASTTFYGTQDGEANDPYLNNEKDSSCGCNTTQNGASVLSDWYNAAANDTLFGVDTSKTAEADRNCGSGCGRCFELTTTGNRADNNTWGTKPTENQKIKVVVTNMCPNDSNKWCPRPGTTNGDFISTNFGGTGAYEYHFDLQNSFPDGSGSWAGCEGTNCNAEVQFQEIECPDCVKTALKANCKGTSPGGWAVAKEGCKYS